MNQRIFSKYFHDRSKELSTPIIVAEGETKVEKQSEFVDMSQERQILEAWKPLIDDVNEGYEIAKNMKNICALILENIAVETEPLLESVNTASSDLRPFQEMIVPLFRKAFANISLMEMVGTQVMNQANAAFYVERFYYAGTRSASATAITGLLSNNNRGANEAADFRSKVILVNGTSVNFGQIVNGTTTIKAVGGGGVDLATIIYKEMGQGNTIKLLVKLADGQSLPAVSPSTNNVFIGGGFGDTVMTHVWDNQVGRQAILSTYSGAMDQAVGELLGDFQTIKISIETQAIKAESHKLGFNISLEMLVDMMKQHGEDAKRRIIDAVQWQIAAQINRRLFNLMSSSAEIVSSWSFGVAYTKGNARYEKENFDTLFRKIRYEQARMATKNNVLRANYAIVSTAISAIILDRPGFMSDLAEESGAGYVKLGTLEGITYYLDTWATNDYVMLIAKSKQSNMQAGVFYCPYMPLTMSATADPSMPSNQIVLFTERSGYARNPYGANEYITYFDVDLTDSSFYS